MSALIPALAGALVVAGLIGLVVGIRPVPVPAARPPQARRGGPLTRRLRATSRRTRFLAVAGLAAGVAVFLATGWIAAIPLGPIAAVGLPALLAATPGKAQIARLEAMEEWTRSLAGVLEVGVGLEQALATTLKSTPELLRPAVSQLVGRLRAQWTTEAALRRFADDLDDPVGDLIAAYLVLGARHRGAGLASILENLAESVAAEVRTRRAIEADWDKPRSTARWVTLITGSVLLVLALTGSYIQPYTTPIGQLILAALLAAYIGLLAWMRAMAARPSPPRFIGAAARAEVDR